MKISLNKIFMSFFIIFSFHNCRPSTPLLTSNQITALTGIGGLGALITTYKLYSSHQANKISLENAINQFTLTAETANSFLKDLTVHRNTGAIESCITTRFATRSYPAYEYSKTIKKLLKELNYYQHIFEIKKSQVKRDPKLTRLVDRYIQSATLLKTKLQSLYDLIPHSHEYKIEKEAKSWRPVRATFIGITSFSIGAVLGAIATASNSLLLENIQTFLELK